MLDYDLIVLGLSNFITMRVRIAKEVKAMNGIPIAVWIAIFCIVFVPLIVRARQKKAIKNWFFGSRACVCAHRLSVFIGL
jgi:hypothetical protein